MAQATATVTPVLNNRESVIQIQLPATKANGAMLPGGRVDLIPGMNFVDTPLWETAKQNPTCKILLTEKIPASRAPEQNPERVGKTFLEEGGPVAKDNPLSSLEIQAAIAVVGELFDVPKMRQFLDQETRPAVAAALRGKIAEIEKHPTVKKKAAGQ